MVKVILYNATTVNGYIAKSNGETPWSKKEWQTFHKTVKEMGNIIVGRRTYEIMAREKAFEGCGNPVVVVVTRSQKNQGKDVIFVDSPEKAVGALRSMKFKRLLLGGGRRLNSSFLLSGLVNEVWIDIEPFLFGDGIRIIDANNLNVKLKVIGFRRLSRDLVQIRYEIVK